MLNLVNRQPLKILHLCIHKINENRTPKLKRF